jgi:hypothetical protein
MIRNLFLFSFLLLIFRNANAGYNRSGADTLISFKPGSGQSFGQESEYFPQNIFGLPDTNGSQNAPSSDPGQVCSIGLGGEIILGFRNYILIDGEGPDFTIFENAFNNPVTSRVFAEPAKLSVSKDGINFKEFPFDSLTLKGCAGIIPTNGKEDPFNPEVSGGNCFDLKDVDLDSIRFIKISDICQIVLDNPGHPYYDPIISGFDLDAVVSWQLVEDSHTDVAKYQDITNFDIDLRNGRLIVCSSLAHNATLRLYNINGTLVHQSGFQTDYTGDIGLPVGLYLLVISSPELETPIFSKIINDYCE